MLKANQAKLENLLNKKIKINGIITTYKYCVEKCLFNGWKLKTITRKKEKEKYITNYYLYNPEEEIYLDLPKSIYIHYSI